MRCFLIDSDWFVIESCFLIAMGLELKFDILDVHGL